MDLDLFINTDARDPRKALVAALNDASQLELPVLAYGDTLNLSVYLVTKAGAYHADAGSGGLACTLGLGRADQASFITSPTFTIGGTGNKAFLGTLTLSADALALALSAGQRVPLTLTFSTAKSAKVTTWLAAQLEIIGSIA